MKKLFTLLSLILFFSALSFAAENEPANNSFAGADTLTFALSDTARIQAGGDYDYYVIHMNDCGALVLNLVNIPGLNLEMYAFAPAHPDSVIGYSGYGGNRVLELLAPAGDIYIRVGDRFGGSSASSSYIISAIIDTANRCECNNNFATACSISDSTSFQAKLRGGNSLWNPTVDVDFYKVNMTQCGNLVLYLKNIPGLNLEMRAYSAPHTDSLIGYSGYGGDRILELTPASGEVYVRVSDRFNALSTSLYGLTVFVDTVDPYECNNSFATAKQIPDHIAFNAKLRGSNLLWTPTQDIDIFKVHMSRCGTLQLRLTNIPGLNLEMRAYSAPHPDSLIGYSGYGGDRALDVTGSAGDVYVMVSDRFNATSASTYGLSVNLDTTDFYECNNTITTASLIPDSITLQARIQGSNNGVIDVDFYKVNMRRCGTLLVSLTNVPGYNHEIHAYSAPSLDSLIGSSGYGGNRTLYVTGSGGYVYLRISDHFGGTTSSLYTLSVYLDTLDFYECNNTFATASPVSDSAKITARILGSNNGVTDLDYYKVQMSRCGTLVLSLTNVAGYNFEMYAYSAPHPDSLIGYSGYGGNRILELTPAGGDVYVRVGDHFGGTTMSTYFLDISIDSIDTYECNNSLATARLISPNTTVVAKIRGSNALYSPTVDVDYYKIPISKCGVLILNLTNVPGYNFEMYAYSDSGAQIAYSNYGGNRSLEIMASPGFVYVRVGDRFNGTTASPYTLAVTLDTSETCECNNTFADACTITTTTTQQAKIRGANSLQVPSVDVDFYLIHMPFCGQLTTNLTNVSGLNFQFTFYKAPDTVNNVGYSGYGGNRSLTLNLLAGDYYIKVEDRFNATSSQPYTLSFTFTPIPAIPVITPAGPFAFCLGDSVVLTTSSIIPHFWNTGDTSKSITVTVTGTYTDTVRIGNGCVAYSNEVNVQADPQPAIPTITPPGPVTFCDGQSAVLTSSSSINNFWTGGSNSTSITVTTPGMYIDTVKANVNCYSVSDPVTVVVNPVPPTPFIAPSSLAICENQTGTLYSSAATGNHWTTGDTASSITVSQAGVYQDTVRNEFGCEAVSNPVTVAVVSLPVANFTSSNTGLTYSFTNTSQNGTTYHWDFGDGDTSNLQSPSHTFTTGGNKTVILTTRNSCGSDTASITLKLPVGIDEVTDEDLMTVHPNPCNVCFVTGNHIQSADLVITDITGRVCYTAFTKISGGYQVELPGSSSGIYFIRNTRTEQVLKFIKAE